MREKSASDTACKQLSEVGRNETASTNTYFALKSKRQLTKTKVVFLSHGALFLSPRAAFAFKSPCAEHKYSFWRVIGKFDGSETEWSRPSNFNGFIIKCSQRN